MVPLEYELVSQGATIAAIKIKASGLIRHLLFLYGVVDAHVQNILNIYARHGQANTKQTNIVDSEVIYKKIAGLFKCIKDDEYHGPKLHKMLESWAQTDMAQQPSFFGTPIAGLCLDAIPADIEARGESTFLQIAFRNVANVTHRTFCEDVPDENHEDNMVAIRRVCWRENDQTPVLIEEIVDSPVNLSHVEEEMMDVMTDAKSDDEADGDDVGMNGQDYNIELRLAPSVEEARHAYTDLQILLKPPCLYGVGYKDPLKLNTILKKRLEQMQDFLCLLYTNIVMG
ncbi:hypothetical protein EV702DRAFT_1196499 [Suillus placidus]|uniref:Uncharacterized protein n=1 Tax=Suillus placidus TaxID=48579 RepID=A0A9P7D4E4_9AGAM|nr:hypothetical protein EV702DRAFT_1196499 [Suillus placidus]